MYAEFGTSSLSGKAQPGWSLERSVLGPLDEAGEKSQYKQFVHLTVAASAPSSGDCSSGELSLDGVGDKWLP